jgi:hypothetical protein
MVKGESLRVEMATSWLSPLPYGILLEFGLPNAVEVAILIHSYRLA